MDIHGLSQSELARRAGITQTSVRRLLTGGYGSKYLHKIAREVGTTPAFLTGETDDPDEDAPPAPELSPSESALLELFRSLETTQRSAVLQVIRAMTGGPAKSDTLHAPVAEFQGEERQ